MNDSTHRQQVSARFSAAARTYSDVSHLQDRVATRVMNLLPAGLSPIRVLDAGCGPGRLLSIAKKRWPNIQSVGVDIAPGMVALARENFSTQPDVHFIEADLNEFYDPDGFDLVLSSSALHWLDPFENGLSRVAELVNPGGLMAVGIMLDGTLSELHASRNAAAPSKKPRLKLKTFTEFEAVARSLSGFRVRRIEQTIAEYDQPNATEVLRSVHAMGVTGGDISRGERPLSRREFSDLTNWYEQHFATPNGVRVTFVVGYLLLEREGI